MFRIPGKSVASAGLLLVVSLFGLGCDQSDSLSFRLKIESDLSGELVVNSLKLPEESPAPAAASSGVNWDEHLTMSRSVGRFDDLSAQAVSFDDMKIRARIVDDTVLCRVNLPCGPETRWIRRLAPVDSAERERARKILDPEGKSKNLGEVVKLVLELPEVPISHGLGSRHSGAEEKVEKQKALLYVDVDRVMGKDPKPIVWHLTWLRAN